jgi:hypothetical protein
VVTLLICSTGGLNNQTYAAAGVEANLDTQFGFGLTWPTPGTFYSTGGEPPFNPDMLTPTDTNEPYTYVSLGPCDHPTFNVLMSMIPVA